MHTPGCLSTWSNVYVCRHTCMHLSACVHRFQPGFHFYHNSFVNSWYHIGTGVLSHGSQHVPIIKIQIKVRKLLQVNLPDPRLSKRLVSEGTISLLSQN